MIVIAVFIIISIGYWMLNKNKEDDQTLTLYGNVDIRQVSLAFEQSGRIISMNVQEGDIVQKGELLAQLNTETLMLQAKQAKANLAIHAQEILKQTVGTRPEEMDKAQAQLAMAKAQLEKANQDFQRLQLLNDRGNGQAISEQEFDAIKSQQAVASAMIQERTAQLQLLHNGARSEDRMIAQSRYDASQAQLELIEHYITQGELRAPVNAIVRARLQEVGEVTTPQKAVYTLALINPKWIRVYVNERDLGRINMGGKAQVIQDFSHNQSEITGQIGYISSVAEFTPKNVQTEEIRTTLVYEVRIDIDDPKDQLKMGQPVTVKIPTSNHL